MITQAFNLSAQKQEQVDLCEPSLHGKTSPIYPPPKKKHCILFNAT